jgi:hypothetical protein
VEESRGGCVVVGQWAMAWLVWLLVLVLVLVSVERRAGAAAAVGDVGDVGDGGALLRLQRMTRAQTCRGGMSGMRLGVSGTGEGGREEGRAKAVAAAREDG